MESILTAHIERMDVQDTLSDWKGVRSLALDEDPIAGMWVKKESSCEGNITRDNLKANLIKFMRSIATQAAYDATGSPKFNPCERIWRRS